MQKISGLCRYQYFQEEAHEELGRCCFATIGPPGCKTAGNIKRSWGGSYVKQRHNL